MEAPMSIATTQTLAESLNNSPIELSVAPDHTTSRRLHGAPKLTIQGRFEKFHRENPHVYDLFVQYALEAKARRHQRYGIQSIAERVRLHLDVEVEDQYSGFKINNTHLSRYARLIEENEPELKSFFTKRQLAREQAEKSSEVPVP
jgi:hypothetical protein